jgi:3D-(3,5/4)-trihydroxycyclohexane-1,2-dione acylhydrolase (decyclizing)
VSINVTELDAYKRSAVPLIGDARATLDELGRALSAGRSYRVAADYQALLKQLKTEWETEVDRVYAPSGAAVLHQSEVIGLLNRTLDARDVIIGAAGSLPGDLHKLWRARDSKSYHLEYGYSCMGYEIAAGLGVKLAAPDREVFVLVGDGSYLMMAQEIATAVQDGIKITVVLLDNHGFSSIGGLSASVGCEGFGTEYRRRSATGDYDGDPVAVDFAANAASLGARATTAVTLDALAQAVAQARSGDATTVIVVPVDRNARVGGYDSWWDVPVAETSMAPSVCAARERYDQARKAQRDFF